MLSLRKSTSFTAAKAILKRLSFESIIIVHNSSKPSLQLKNCSFLLSLFSSPHKFSSNAEHKQSKVLPWQHWNLQQEICICEGLEKITENLWGDAVGSLAHISTSYVIVCFHRVKRLYADMALSSGMLILMLLFVAPAKASCS